MHVSDALISPPVAGATALISLSLIAIGSKKIKENKQPDIIPMMGIMGAFVFAAQMINFTIPGTGSSGHLIGGVLLSALLGPWCAFITLSSILIVQCLFFADGGILALGCNIFNMAAASCLLAYPLIYKPIAGTSLKTSRIVTAAILASVGALEIGALAVTVETELSGVTALPFLTFIKFMLPIHLAIGLVEGLVTASLILFIATYRPSALFDIEAKNKPKRNNKTILWAFGIVALTLAAGFTFLASEFPDGLEWSVAKVAGHLEENSYLPPTAIMPDYDSKYAGIAGGLIVMFLLWCVTSLLFAGMKKSQKKK